MAGTRGSALGPSPWLGDSYLSSCLLTLSSLCACLCPSFPSSQGPWSCWTRAHTNDLISIRWALQYTTVVAQVVKNRPANRGDVRDAGSIPGSGRCLKEEMATHSSIHAWRIPWTEEPSGLQSWGCKELDMTEWLSTRARKPHPPASPNKVTCWGTGWLGLEHMNLGGEYSSRHNQHHLLSTILEMCLVVCSLMGRQWWWDCDRGVLWGQGCQGATV